MVVMMLQWLSDSHSGSGPATKGVVGLVNKVEAHTDKTGCFSPSNSTHFTLLAEFGNDNTSQEKVVEEMAHLVRLCAHELMASPALGQR